MKEYLNFSEIVYRFVLYGISICITRIYLVVIGLYTRYSVLGTRGNAPVEERGLLLLHIVAGHIAGLVATVLDTPPVLGIVQQQVALVLAQIQLLCSLGCIIILGYHVADVFLRFSCNNT